MWVQAASASADSPPPASGNEAEPISYARASDEQLTALAARWDALDPAARRALLSEVKMRMARHQNATRGILRIRLTRRYGAVPQEQGKGRLHIQLRTERKGAQGFGVGFEQRTGQGAPAPKVPEDAAVKAADSG